MMSILVELGKGNVTLDFVRSSLLEGNDRRSLKTIAPGSGLQLYSVVYQ